MKATCPRCQMLRRARNPKGGDGTAVIICRHDRTVYDHMQGERVREQCDGSFTTVDADQLGTGNPTQPCADD